MPTLRFIILFLLTSIVFFSIDLIWLGFVGKDIYQHYLGHLMAENTNWVAAFSFYFIYIAGIFHFCINPALKVKSVKLALKNGALFGFFCYSTFELTALAVLKEWPIGIVSIDIIWGIILTSLVSLAGYKISRKINFHSLP